MKRNLLLLGFAMTMVCAVPVRASEPGQPLDCSDWVFLEPGYSCTPYIPYRCEDIPDSDELCDLNFDGLVTDNEGYFYRVEMLWDVGPDCDGKREDRLQIVRFDNSSEMVIAYLQDRCWNEDPTCYDEVRPHGFTTANPGPRLPVLRFDPIQGQLLVSLQIGDGPSDPITPCTPYLSGQEIISIGGFTSLFNLLQSFQPSAGTLSLRVPLAPEGFEAADWFDTYYGNLSTVGDWSQAQPLQCGYPASAPSAGDYLIVQDTLPTPSSGQGYYYVTAATYQGETRYGRKSSGGGLTGRDPAVLPACNE